MNEENCKKENFKDIFLKFLLGKNNHRLSAKDAYLQSKYNIIETDEERLAKLKNSIDALISAKTQVGDYCCAIQVEDDLEKYLGDIIKEYIDLGYTVIDLNKSIAEVENTYLFFCWDKKF